MKTTLFAFLYLLALRSLAGCDAGLPEIELPGVVTGCRADFECPEGAGCYGHACWTYCTPGDPVECLPAEECIKFTDGSGDAICQTAEEQASW